MDGIRIYGNQTCQDGQRALLSTDGRHIRRSADSAAGIGRCITGWMEHHLCGDCLEVFFSIPLWNLPEEWNNEIEKAAPEGGIDFEYSL
jgi:hypothetical protein